MTALEAHLDAGGPRPDLPLDLRGTAFQVRVWRFLLTVPEGEVLSYGELAERSRVASREDVPTLCQGNPDVLKLRQHQQIRPEIHPVEADGVDHFGQGFLQTGLE